MSAVAQPAPLTSQWWVPLVEGILAIILGFLFFTSPATTAIAFVFGLGLYWLVVGAVDLISIFQNRTAWGWRLFSGIVGVLAGFWIISGILGPAHPLGVAFAVGSAFTWVLGILGIVYGIINIFGAFQGGGWWPGILGAIGILFGIWLLSNPVAATLALPFSIGMLLIAGGIALVIAAFRLRSGAI
jgi:uncharacterized membrane protein HdeD (DUF308 family)